MHRPVQILLVEDDPGDVVLIREGLKQSKLLIDLHHVDDGEKALRFLRREAPYVSAVKPELVILDINLPRKNGFEVLQEMKADPELKVIPVVILTTSQAESDIYKGYDLAANCYVTKPLDLDKFIQVVNEIEEFWITIVRRPR